MRSYAFAEGSSLPAVITIQKALETVRFTTWHRAVTLDEIDYPTAPGADVTGFTFPADGTPSAADVTVMAVEGGLFTPADGIRGMLDGWPITIAIFDPAELSAGASTLLTGTIGSVSEDANGMLVIAANGPLRMAQMRPLTEHYSLICRADLGGDTCKVPVCGHVTETYYDIGRAQAYVTKAEAAPGLQTVKDCYGRAHTGSPDTVQGYGNLYFECTTAGTTDADTAPSYDPTVGNTTDDGTAVFTARDAWLRYATGEATDAFTIVLDALPDARASDETWYVDGGAFVRSGPLQGTKLTLRAWDPNTLTLTLFLPIDPADIAADTQFEIYPGCDRTSDMCFVRFDNTANRRSEVFVPQPDFTQSIPQKKIDNLATAVQDLLP